MRVTSNSLREAFLKALQRTQQNLNKTQVQIATGKRVNRPSDDPLGAARIGALQTSIDRIAQYQRNAVLATNHLGLEEQTLVGVTDTLQRIRELALQANTATASTETFKIVATELKERLSKLVDSANATDGEGHYLFAGYSEKTQPFAQTAAGVVYNGDQGRRSLQIGDSRLLPVADPGSEVFQRIVNGNGTFVLAADPANAGTGVLGAGTLADPTAYVADDYTIAFTSTSNYEIRDGGGALVLAGSYAPGDLLSFRGMQIELSGTPAAGDQFTVEPSSSQGLFETLQGMIAALESTTGAPASRAWLNSYLGQALVDLDQASGHVVDVRATVGTRLATLDAETSLNEGLNIQLTSTLSNIQDVDYAEAISSLSQQMMGLDAAQQSYARLQDLSLFRYL